MDNSGVLCDSQSGMRIQKSIHLGSWIMSVTMGSSNARIRLQPRPQGFSLREWEKPESPGDEVDQILGYFFFDLFFPVKWGMGQRGRPRALAVVYCEFHVTVMDQGISLQKKPTNRYFWKLCRLMLSSAKISQRNLNIPSKGMQHRRAVKL